MPCNHPESNTIPCMECGRKFCSICNPLKGAGQYCPVCYEKQLSGLVRKTTKPSKKERIQQKTDSTRGKVGDTALAIREKAKGTVLAIKDSPRKSASFFLGKAKDTRSYFNGRFPVTLVKKQGLDGIPPLRETWYKFLTLTLGGAAVWILVASVAHQRNPLTSLCIAVLVAVGVVWTFNERNDMTVSMVAVVIVLATLLIGEVGIQLFIRFGIVKKMDLTSVSIYSLNRTGSFYSQFMFKVIVWRILPGAVMAFLIGLWPLPKRLSWKGFVKKDVAPEPVELQASS